MAEARLTADKRGRACWLARAGWLSGRHSTYFDQRSGRYVGDEWHAVYTRRLVELANLTSGQRVLDAATGTGFAALVAAHAVGPTGQVVGIDISDGMLSQAERLRREAGLDDLKYVRSDAAALPGFEDESFDVVVCSAGMLYLPVHTALTAWQRVLRPSGLVGFSAMCAGYPVVAAVFRQCAAEADITLTDPHVELGDEQRCRQALDDAGFESARIVPGEVRLPDSDMAERWRLHVNSPHYPELHTLSASQRDALCERFTRVLAEHNSDIGLAPVLYAFGRKP